MTTQFSDRQFRFSHGTAPRGRGTWAFVFRFRSAPEETFWVTGDRTFSEARREAMRVARERGAESVEVGS